MTDLAISPRRVDVNENSEQLFQDMFALSNGQPPNRIPWKDRNLPMSFFQPPPEPIESQPTYSAPNASLHAYSRSVPAYNCIPPRPMYQRQQPVANLWGNSTLPGSSNTTSQQLDYSNNVLKETSSFPPVDPYKSTPPNNFAYGQQPSSQFFQPQVSNPTHISHGRQNSLPYPYPKRTNYNQRFVNPANLKHQQSKPAPDFWSNQPSPHQVDQFGPNQACQFSGSQPNLWQASQAESHDANVFGTTNTGVNGHPAPASYQEWQQPASTSGSVPVTVNPSNNSWSPAASNATKSESAISDNQSQLQPSDDQRTQLLFLATKLKEERDRMQAKVSELDRKLEDVMSALSVNPTQPQQQQSNTNGYYSNGSVGSATEELVPSLQIGSNNLDTPWM